MITLFVIVCVIYFLFRQDGVNAFFNILTYGILTIGCLIAFIIFMSILF